MALDDLLSLFLECIVAAAGENADQEHGQPRVGLHVVDGPVLVLVGEVRDREAVCEDHDKLHEGAHEGDDPQGRVELATLRELVVEAGEDGQQEEELEVVCYVPGPGETGVRFAPGDHVVEEYDMPEPVLRAFCVRLILMEKGTVTTEEDKELPVEENGEYVQRQKSHHAVDINEEFRTEEPVLLLHLSKHKVGAYECGHPEKYIGDMLGREDSAEDKALHPVLDDIHILQGSTLESVEVGLAQDYHGTGKDSQTIEDFKFCILWVLQGTILEQSD